MTYDGIEIADLNLGSDLQDLVESSPERARVKRNARQNRTSVGNTIVKDHFSLSNPSSAITFADTEAIVFVDNFEQVSLEKKDGTNYFTAKQASVSSPGLLLSRLAYTMIALLMSGFVFVFCIQIVLFLFLGLAIESGLTSQKDFSWFTFFGTLLSIPIFISGLSQVMVIANTFVIDTWNGSKFFKTMGNWNSTLVDWVTLFVFFGFPLLIGSVSLCTLTAHWWTYTSISWFCIVFWYYVMFALCAIYYEIDGCLELVRYHPKLRMMHDENSNERTWTAFYNAAKLRMKQRLSGYSTVTFISNGTDKNPTNLTFDEITDKQSFRSFIGPLSWLTTKMGCFYTVLDTPQRQYSVDEVLEFTPYVTNSSWGLESVYFRNRSNRFIAIIDGQASLSKSQVRSSLICFLIGTLFKLFLLVSLLVWLQAPVSAILVFGAIYLLSVLGNVKKSIGLNAAYKAVNERDDGSSNNEIQRNKTSTALYQVQDTFRISEPKELLYWLVLSLDLIFFFVIPLAALFSAGNIRVAIVFIVIGIISTVRNVFNAPSVLKELGSLDGIEINNDDNQDGLSEWREKNRLARIVSEISAGKKSKFWSSVFLFFVLIFCMVFIAAVTLGADKGVEDKMIFAPKEEFYYKGSQALNLAACSFGHNIRSPDGITNSLADFAFLSNVAYLDDTSTTEALEGWFGDLAVENLSDTVTDFTTEYQAEFGASAVTYKLFHFPAVNGEGDLDIVGVRGTSNAWDALTDAQLWSSAALAQYIRDFLPLGSLWTPILPHLVKAVSVIEAQALEDVAYYKETGAFVRYLKGLGKNVQIVGHSLGGGLAMITGAQEEIPAVGLSGPNNMISRLTFSPEISVEALTKYTFNIVPDRDPVPRIDDLAQNYQRIECRAAPNRPVDCHFGKRSFCEILATCGTQNLRPIPCFCVTEYGYDAPESVNGEDFFSYCSN